MERMRNRRGQTGGHDFFDFVVAGKQGRRYLVGIDKETRMQRLHGNAAIEYAQALGTTLCKYADATEDARDQLTPEAAREITAIDGDLIYLDLPTAAVSAIRDACDWMDDEPDTDQWRAAIAPGTLGADEGLFHAMDDEDLEETLGHPRWVAGEQNEAFADAAACYSTAWAVTVRLALER